jgi:hypothetical protein
MAARADHPSLKGVTNMRALFAVVTLVVITLPAYAAVPANNSRRNAVRIDTLPFVDAVDTREATTAEADPSCAGRANTVWYTFTPRRDTLIEIDTFTSTYDTTLSVYVQTGSDFLQAACNDDSQELQSRVAFKAIAGLTYYVMVGAFEEEGGGRGGDLVLSARRWTPLTTVRINGGTKLVRPGVTSVTGTVACDPSVFIEVRGSVSQEQGTNPAWGRFSAFVSCATTGKVRWHAGVLPMGGLFKAGHAMLFGSILECTESACDERVFEGRLRLRR